MKERRTFYDLGVAGFWWLTWHDRTGWNQIGLKSLSTMVSRKQLAWNNLWHGTCHMRISKGWLTWQQALPLILLMADWRRLAWLWQDGTPNSINAPMRIHVPGGSSLLEAMKALDSLFDANTVKTLVIWAVKDGCVQKLIGTREIRHRFCFLTWMRRSSFETLSTHVCTRFVTQLSKMFYSKIKSQHPHLCCSPFKILSDIVVFVIDTK